MYDKKVSSRNSSAQEMGLVSKEKLDYKNIRGDTGETQRPKHTTTSVKTDKGTFKEKG